MKPCPYCAELIQDQAAKCRYCGEWLDPSKRPAWSESSPAVPAAAPAPAPAPEASEPPPEEPTSATLPVGSGLPDLNRPSSDSDPEPARSWSAPAWLANAQAARTEPSAEPASADERSKLEEVALRMERIRQSAAEVQAEPPSAQATLEVEPGVTLPAGSVQDLLDNAVARAKGRDKPSDDELPALQPRQRPMQVNRADRPTIPDIPREELLAETDQIGRMRQRAAEDDLDERPARRKRRTADDLDERPARRKRRSADDLDDLDERPDRRKRRSADDDFDDLDEPPARKKRRSAADDLDDLDDLDESPARKKRHDDDFDDLDDLDDLPARKRRTADAAPPPADDFFDDDDGDDFDEPLPKAGGFDDGFMDDDGEDYDDDDYGDDDFDDFDDMGSAPQPLPWKPILIAAGFIVVFCVLLFRDYLFSGDPDTDEIAEADSEGGSGEVPDDVKEETPPPETKAAGEGQPVEPEAGSGGEAEASGGVAQPETPQPAALDPETLALLDEARKAYEAANGSVRKLGPVGEKLQTILTKAPDHPEALTLMAQVYLEQGKMEESLSTSNRCTEVSPESAGCWLTIGVIQETKGKKDIAKPAYQKYLDLAPEGRYAKDAKKALARIK